MADIITRLIMNSDQYSGSLEKAQKSLDNKHNEKKLIIHSEKFKFRDSCKGCNVNFGKNGYWVRCGRYCGRSAK